MPAGLQVINDAGTIQIDSTWANYVLVDVQTIVSVQDAQLTSGAFFRGSIYTGSQGSDLVFAYCASTFSYVGESYINSVRRVGVATRDIAGIPVTFYTYRKQQPTGSTFGMQVFDETGTLTFDAASNFARIVQYIPPAQMYGSGFFSLPPGRKYAICVPSFCGRGRQETVFNPGAGPDYFINFYRDAPLITLSSSSVAIGGLEQYLFFQIPSGSSGATRVYIGNWTPGIIADITGL